MYLVIEVNLICFSNITLLYSYCISLMNEICLLLLADLWVSTNNMRSTDMVRINVSLWGTASTRNYRIEHISVTMSLRPSGSVQQLQNIFPWIVKLWDSMNLIGTPCMSKENSKMSGNVNQYYVTIVSARPPIQKARNILRVICGWLCERQ
jgi:hypothetical protein